MIQNIHTENLYKSMVFNLDYSVKLQCGYRYDTETQLYYLQSRYYNPEWGRFINIDSKLNPQSGLTGMNLFCYGGNNPVNTIDPTGNAFMFLTAAIGAVAGAVTGGVLAAAQGKDVLKGALIGAAVGGLVGLGAGAAAGVFLAGSATASTAAVMAGGATLVSAMSAGGLGAGTMYVASNVQQAVSRAAPATQTTKVVSEIKNDIINLDRVKSALKTDLFHAFPDIVDNYAGFATKTSLNNGSTLYQLSGSWTNQMGSYTGRFEWIVQGGQVTHRMFVQGGGMNGIPILP